MQMHHAVGRGTMSLESDDSAKNQERIVVSSGEDSLQGVRAELMRLLEGEELEHWRITRTALESGRRVLPEYKGHFGAYAIRLFILDLLRANFPLHQVELGSGNQGLVMNN